MTAIWRPFKNLIVRLINSGHQHAQNDLELRQIQLSNRVFMIFPFMAFQYMFVFLYAGHVSMALTFIPCVGICFVYLWLNHLGYTQLSRHMCYNIYNGVLIFYSTNVPDGTFVELFFVTSIYLPMLFFRKMKPITFFLGCIMPIILFFSRHASFWPRPLLRDYAPENFIVFQTNVFLSIFLFIFFTIYIFFENSASYEKKLEESMSNLHEAQAKLLDSAHRAGMAEIASTILHNIGNSANSLNTEIAKMKRNILAQELEVFSQLIPYMDKLLRKDEFDTESKITRTREILGEFIKLIEKANSNLESATTRINKISDHIIKSINSQQKYATGIEVKQSVNIKELIDDSLDLIRPKIEKQKISLNLQVDPSIRISITKVKMVNVVVNLLSNAIDAMDRVIGHKTLTVSSFLEGDFAFIEITDNGHGFNQETGKQLFQYGFTTKRHGHGFGLHDCANTVAQMGGEIAATSPGLNKGATFRIRLPVSIRDEYAA